MSTRASDRDLVRDLDRALAHSFDLDCAIDHNRASRRARHLVNDLGRILDRASILDLGRAFDRASNRAFDRASALDRDLALVSGMNRSAFGRASSSAFDLVHVLDHASELNSELARMLDSTRRPAVLDRGHLEREVRRVAPSAARLLAVVARLLPASDRARYDEEFRSELQDLAQAGAGRFRQVAYALRQLRYARLTVAALRSPRRRGVTP